MYGHVYMLFGSKRLDLQAIIVLTLEVVGQLCQVNQRVSTCFNKALIKLASGPGQWINTADASCLQKSGLPSCFNSIMLKHQAAKIRLVRFDFPDIQALHNQLEHLHHNIFRRPFN